MYVTYVKYGNENADKYAINCIKEASYVLLFVHNKYAPHSGLSHKWNPDPVSSIVIEL